MEPQKINTINQNLFNALQDVCGYIALQSDMEEILRAVAKDEEEKKPEPPKRIIEELTDMISEQIWQCEEVDVSAKQIYRKFIKPAILLADYRKQENEKLKDALKEYVNAKAGPNEAYQKAIKVL
jgi:hypothetical protein